ncbi:MAG: DUF4293 domain-containing protein [Bacteroidales bacterium]|nr:DUF4293 domain-containing protein [Bacteroidales bacterium]
MLQRIQSLYLLVISILSTTMLFTPLADLYGNQKIYAYKALGVYETTGTLSNLYLTAPVFAVILAIALISFITIFLYKKRMLQIRFSIFNAVLMVAFYGIFFLYFWLFKDKLGLNIGVNYILAFPLVAFVFNWLAIRAIGADEALIRSLDRIR